MGKARSRDHTSGTPLRAILPIRLPIPDSWSGKSAAAKGMLRGHEWRPLVVRNIPHVWAGHSTPYLGTAHGAPGEDWRHARAGFCRTVGSPCWTLLRSAPPNRPDRAVHSHTESPCGTPQRRNRTTSGIGREPRTDGATPRQLASRNKSDRVRSADSCSGKKVWVARLRLDGELPVAPRRQCKHLGSSWHASGRNISFSSLGRLYGGGVRSLRAAGELPACSLA